MRLSYCDYYCFVNICIIDFLIFCMFTNRWNTIYGNKGFKDQQIGTVHRYIVFFLYDFMFICFLLFLYHWCIVYLLNMYLLHNTLVFSYSCDLYSNFYMSHAYVLLLLLSGFTVVQLFNYLGLGWLLCSSSIVRFHVCNKHSHIHHMSIPVISIYKILIHIYI